MHHDRNVRLVPVGANMYKSFAEFIYIPLAKIYTPPTRMLVQHLCESCGRGALREGVDIADVVNDVASTFDRL